MSYQGLTNDMCIPSGADSYRVEFPILNFYEKSTSCIGTAIPIKAFQTQCGAANSTQFDDDNMPSFSFENGGLMTGSCKFFVIWFECVFF